VYTKMSMENGTHMVSPWGEAPQKGSGKNGNFNCRRREKIVDIKQSAILTQKSGTSGLKRQMKYHQC